VLSLFKKCTDAQQEYKKGFSQLFISMATARLSAFDKLFGITEDWLRKTDFHFVFGYLFIYLCDKPALWNVEETNNKILRSSSDSEPSLKSTVGKYSICGSGSRRQLSSIPYETK
jgi:hypothetical protein